MIEILLWFWCLSGLAGWVISHKHNPIDIFSFIALPFCLAMGPIVLVRKI